MSKNETLKRVFRNILGELIVLFAPKALSPLHLASFYKSRQTKERKELLKLSKKILKINTQISLNDLKNYQQDITSNNIKLFNDVYKRKNDLTLRELKILRNYCLLLKNNYRPVINEHYIYENKDFIDSNCNEILDEIIDKKTKTKKKMLSK